MSQYPNQPQFNPAYSPQPQAMYTPPGAPLDAPPRTSGAAVTSLICGLLGCLPVLITSILAVIFGIIGIRTTRDPRYTGRGLAIAGLVLGIIGLLIWGSIGVAAIGFYRFSQPVAQTVQSFTSNLANGNVSAAQAQCDPSLTQAELQTLADQLQQSGTLQDLMIPTRKYDQTGGQAVWRLEGIAQFGKGTKSATFTLRQQSDGTFKISSAKFE